MPATMQPIGSIEQGTTFLRDLRRAARFRGRYRELVYRGVFASFEQAAASIPEQALRGFDHDAVVKLFEGPEGRWRLHDYPVAVWMGQLLDAGDQVVDLGGGVGQMWYHLQKYAAVPERLNWVVCDLEAFCRRGRELAAERGESRLCFVTALGQVAECDVLLAGGALQYIRPDLATLLAGFSALPRAILVNQLPVYDGPEYYTVQRMHYSCCPYRISNRGEFVRRIVALGYRLRDSWSLPREVHIPFHPGRKVSEYAGFYFERKV